MCSNQQLRKVSERSNTGEREMATTTIQRRRTRRRKLNDSLMLIIISCTTAGCTSVILPLCPAIAANSYPAQSEANYVNFFAKQNAEASHITISPLSWFSARFSGSIWDVETYKNSYKSMLCAFSPVQQQILIRQTYGSCMAHADNWITIVSSDKPEVLMTTQTLYYENCVSGTR